MSFSQYKSLGATLKELEISFVEENFMQEVSFDIRDYFLTDLEFMLNEGVVDNSEYAICENLIYPILKEVWKPFAKKFTLWSHQYLNYTDNLTGFPEYILAKRSPLGKVVFDKPYFLLIEAKQDNFDAAWGQCLAEMYAAQKLNNLAEIAVFGITSNGDRWQFGKLEGDTFTRNKTFYSIQEIEHLFAAVNFIFQDCDRQLSAIAQVADQEAA
ncbi:MAG: hypothetical protein WCP16_11325 [Pseudanabaena sp. ELA645]|jgi:hypothetical protein